MKERLFSSPKNIIVSALVLLLLTAGLISGAILVQRNQEIRRKAQEACSACDGQLTSMTLRYLGSSPAQIKVIQKQDQQSVFDGPVNPGQEFSFNGVWKNSTLSTNISVYVNNQLNVDIHTSCSDPNVAPGSIYGDFLIIKATSRNGGEVCPISPIPTQSPSPSPSILPTESTSPTIAPTPSEPGEPTATATALPQPTATESPESSPSPSGSSAPIGGIETACLGDRVVIDKNRNGVQDSGETGLGEVKVECYDTTGKFVASAITDNQGYYKICNLIPGKYQVKFIIPQEYTLSNENTGTNDLIDSDAAEESGITQFISLSAGDNNISLDALVYVLSTSTTNPASTQESVTTSPDTNVSTPAPSNLPEAGTSIYTYLAILVASIPLFLGIALFLI